MKKLLLHEDMFFDIPNVDYKLDTELELKGPEPGEDVGVSGLLLDLIGDVAKNINDYNQLQANLENYPEIAELIKDFADDENMKLGKIQTALKTISPNAEYIMNGAVEAEEEMDPGSPLDESLKEDFDPKSYDQALDDYMSSKNISVEKLFGALNYDDPRYKQLFNSLKDLGYKPRETGTYSRGYFVPAMTITVSTRKVPDDVIDLIHKLAGVTGRHIGFHKGANNWKLKFELRDDDFSSFKDKIFQSLNESLNEGTNFVSKDVINLLNDYFRNHLRADNTWAEIDSVEIVGKDTYKVEVHFKGINTYSTVDSDGYRYTEYEDTDEYKTYVVKVNGNYVSIISNESLEESNESWDSSRALDVARYCWDKGYDEDKAYQVTVAQLKKEGSALPKDLDRVKTVIYDYYDEQGEGEDDFFDESLKNHI